MIFKYPQVNKTAQVLKDLIKINNDRIGGYQGALLQSRHLDAGMTDLFNSIISSAMCYRQQLMQKVKLLDTDVKNSSNLLGKIYMAWNDLKVTVASDTRRAIIANCLYNEEIALHAYRAALSADYNFHDDVPELLCEHEAELRKNCDLLKRYRAARFTVDSSSMQLI